MGPTSEFGRAVSIALSIDSGITPFSIQPRSPPRWAVLVSRLNFSAVLAKSLSLKISRIALLASFSDEVRIWRRCVAGAWMNSSLCSA